ncbi:MAG TPA: helix-turn-helix domain-containing protein [Candidatus Udaeobacter sp.]|nr:helix-turn-helix domain-containing protein [Candidatus Udaeobacter sp.]
MPTDGEKEKSITLGEIPSTALFSKNQLAAYLNCTSRYIERMVNAGQLKQLKPSPKMVRFRRSDVEAFLES